MADRPGADATWRRASLRVSGGYLAYFAAVGALMPFIALYFRQLGFSGVQVGVLTALPSIGLAVAAPLSGAIADGAGAHRAMLRVSLVLAAVAALLVTQVSAFPAVFTLFAVLALASAPIAPLVDSYGVTASERSGRSYGRIRVWGPVGYMASVLGVGWLMGDDATAALLVVHALALLLALVAMARLPALAERRRAPLLDGMREVLRDRAVGLLLMVTWLLSVGAAIISIYLGVRIEEIGGSARQVGVAFAVASASELPVMAFGGWLLARYGATRVIALGAAIYAARFVAFSVITVPVWVLPVQALHGLSYAAFTLASVTLIHRLVRQERAATAQALLTSVALGFGAITGSLAGGALLDTIGTQALFLGTGVVMLVALGVLLVGERVIGLAPRD